MKTSEFKDFMRTLISFSFWRGEFFEDKLLRRLLTFILVMMIGLAGLQVSLIVRSRSEQEREGKAVLFKLLNLLSLTHSSFSGERFYALSELLEVSGSIGSIRGEKLFDMELWERNLGDCFDTLGIETEFALYVYWLTPEGERYRLAENKNYYRIEGNLDRFEFPIFMSDSGGMYAGILVKIFSFRYSLFDWFLFILSVILSFCLSAAILWLAAFVIRERIFVTKRTEFCSNMLHEIKSPIANVSLAAEIIKEHQPEDAVTQKTAQIIIDEGSRLKQTADRVLQLSLIESKRVKLKLELADIVKELQAILDSFGEIVNKRGGKLLSEMPDKPVFVPIDILHFVNVIYNLLENAFKYSVGATWIRVILTEEDEQVVIQIEDRGIGIPDDKLSHVFDTFYRASSARDSGIEGTGLGLSYVKKIVNKHKGDIFVKRNKPGGVTFSISLPKK